MAEESISVLVIDDDAGDIALLKRHIKEITDVNISMSSCGSAAEGLATLGGGGFDVVLLDYQLGADSGLTVLRAIKEGRHTCSVIMLTGRGDEAVAVESMHHGAHDYLRKSKLSRDSLRRVLNNAMEKRRLERMIEEHRDHLARTNAELAKRNREIEGFYHSVSHELKTPLTSIKEFLGIVLEGLAGPIAAEQREYLEIALESASEMGRTIGDLLDATRIETGKLSLARATESIGELVERIAKAMSPTAEQCGLELTCRIEADLPSVLVDAERIAQVLRNLISNAFKFTPAGKSVEVAAATDPDSDEWIVVTVADTGRGIEPELQEQIFERLYQVTHEDYATEGGLGLGLSISKDIVELHGGRISVASELDVGTTFSFTVPVDQASAASVEQERLVLK